jgi:sulfite exporter TauE/SafE
VLSALALSFAALVFLTTALPSLAALFPVLARVRLPLPGRLFHRALSALSRPRGPGGRFGLGLLMGLMPCGLVVAALLAAAVLGSPLKAAGGMAVFATGTLPGLLAVAFGGQALARFNPAALKFVQPAMLVASTVILLLAAGRITLL